jgi:cytochrome c biogenesis protein CcmG/thiol:disulfide interchange protein DsbE
MTSPAGDRRARRQARRDEARRAASTEARRSRWLIPGLLAVVIVIAAALAILLPGASRPGSGGSSSLPPTTAASGASAASGATSEDPVITGAALPDFQNPNGDPAVGLPAPEVAGTDFSGKPVTIAKDGRPKVIVFLTHWCPHCQAEAPLIQAWFGAGGVPAGVDLISVVTSIDPARPNYPPDAWLAREGWTVPVIVDPTNSVAGAYGLSAFPYWVFVAPDGTVKARAVGGLPIANLQTIIGELTGS